MKVLLTIVGALLVFVGLGIGTAYSQTDGWFRYLTLIVAACVVMGGWALLNRGLGLSRRWEAWKKNHSGDRYTPKGGGM